MNYKKLIITLIFIAIVVVLVVLAWNQLKDFNLQELHKPRIHWLRFD